MSMLGGVALVASAASTHTLKKQSDGGALSPHKNSQSVSRDSPLAHSLLHAFDTSHPQSHSSS